MLEVLCLDDEPELCEIFSDEFSSPEVKVTWFTDADSALRAANDGNYQLIFLDYRLPGTTGDLVALKMRPEIPKYLITGDLNIETKYKFLKVFEKPYDKAKIKAEIDKYIKRLS